MAEKCARTDKSDTEMDTCSKGDGNSRYKKKHMTNIYLTNKDKEAIVDFVKDPNELYDKTNDHFMDKARKKCLCERFAKSCNLCVKMCKTCFDLQRTRYGRLM